MGNNGNMHDEAFEPAKLAPHSQDAEEAVLGSILINPEAYLDVAGFLRADDFFLLHNSWIWEAMQRLDRRGDPVEYLTIIEELRNQERLDSVGGAANITRIASGIGTSVHAKTYGRIVERAAIRRRYLEAAAEITRLAREEDVEISLIIDKAESAVYAVSSRHREKHIWSAKRVFSNYFDLVQYRYKRRGEVIGVPSGFIDLDNLVGNFQPKDLILIAARPSVGKTSLMLNAAVNAARLGMSVAVFSLEMGKEQLMNRIAAIETGINSTKLWRGDLSKDEFSLFVNTAHVIDELPLYFDDTPALTVNQLRTKCKLLQRTANIDLVIVDYLQLMNSGEKTENNTQEVGKISRGLKQLAMEMTIPFVVGSQLSRAVEQRTDKRPVLSDLRESGSLEQDSDVVMFIYRDELYNEATERPNEADIIVRKNRNGATGTATLYFRKQLTQFANLKKTGINLGDF